MIVGLGLGASLLALCRDDHAAEAQGQQEAERNGRGGFRDSGRRFERKIVQSEIVGGTGSRNKSGFNLGGMSIPRSELRHLVCLTPVAV